MKRNALFLMLIPLVFPHPVFAETIELVTYYPSASNNSFDRFHADRGTLGDPYSLGNPADPLPSGILLIADALGIGTDFSAASLPATALQITTGQGIRVRQGLPTGGLFDGTGYELYRDGVERMHLYYNTTLNWVELNTGATPNASLAFVNNGGQTRMFLDGASGNIGMGTMAPVFPLEVVRNQNATIVAGGFSNTSAGNAGVTDLRVGQDVETGNGQYGALNYYGSGTPAGFQGYGNPNQVSLVAALRAVNGLAIATNANAPIKFLTNSNGVNNERMRITPDGRILIGTAVVPPTAPTTVLAVRRDANEMVFGRIENTNNDVNSAARMFVVSQQANTPISIGVDAFSQNFNAGLMGDFAPGSTAVSTFATFNVGGVQMPANRGNLFIASRGPNQRIGFHTGSTLINAASERMRITEIGRVGIGIANPLFNLDVAAPAGQDGNIRIRGGGNVARLRLENTGPGGRNWSISSLSNAFSPAGGFAIADETAAIQRLMITNTGRVGVGRSPTNHAFEVEGDAGKTVGGDRWKTLSDAHLKQDVHPLQGALSKILDLRGVTFEWKDPSHHGGESGPQMGLIAQEVEKVFPQWVSEDDNGFKWLGPIGFDALSIEAIRELNQRIDQLKAENETLKARVEALEKK